MRWVGALLVLFGVVASFTGILVTFGAIFEGSSRHTTREETLVLGKVEEHRFTIEPDEKYALAVSVLVDRAGLPIDSDAGTTSSPVLSVSAKFPIEVNVTDASGRPLPAKASGTFGPGDPGVMVFGRAEVATGPVEVEKMIGSVTTTGKQEITVTTRVSADPTSAVKVTGAVVRMYDYRFPRGAVAGLIAVGTGVVAFVAGLVVLVMAGRKKKRDRA